MYSPYWRLILFRARDGGSRSEEKPPEQVPDAEEDEDHDRHHSGDQSHHRQQFRACAAVHAGILAQSGPLTPRGSRGTELACATFAGVLVVTGSHYLIGPARVAQSALAGPPPAGDPGLER